MAAPTKPAATPEHRQALYDKWMELLGERELALIFTRLVLGEDQADPKEVAESWADVELKSTLDAILSGTWVESYPEVGEIRHGKGGLFRKGEVNSLFGESGSGKSWTALIITMQLLVAGKKVLYIDFESNKRKIVQRLVTLGFKEEHLKLFTYKRPDLAIDDEQLSALLMQTARTEFVVIDSTGEALSIESKDPNADDKVAEWFRRMPGAIAQTGPAVLTLDHVPKSSDDSSLWAVGSHRKRAAVSGTAYRQNMRKDHPFSKDVTGWAELRCAKDRDGSYGAGEIVAETHYEAGIGFSIIAPLKSTKPTPDEEAKMKIVELLQKSGPKNKEQLRTELKMSPNKLNQLTSELVATDHIEVSKVGRETLCTFKNPYATY